MARKPLLLQWNTRSLLSRKDELLRILRMHAADIVAISETWLLSHHHFRVPGYDVLRCDRAAGVGGGVALLIKNHRSYLSLNLPPTQVEAVAARVTFGGKVISVASIYDPQGDCPMSDYSDIVNQLGNSFIILGDFNAKHPAWGSPDSNRQGRSLVEWMVDDCDCCILNDGCPTRFHMQTGTRSHLDLTIVSPDLYLGHTWEVLQEGTSDHQPILTSLDVILPAIPEGTTHWCLKRADWPLFRELMQRDLPLCRDSEELDVISNAFTTTLISSAEGSIPTTTSVRGGKIRQDWWNEDCKKAVERKNKARNRVYRHNDPQRRLEYRIAIAACRTTIREAKRKSLAEFAQSVTSDTPLTKVWRIAKNQSTRKSYSIPDLRTGPGQFANLGGPKGEALLRHFFQPNPPPQGDLARLEAIPAGPAIPEEYYNTPLTREELDSALGRLKLSAAGPDRVHNSMLMNLPEPAKVLLLHIFNLSWTAGRVPACWKDGSITPILKPGKSAHDPGGYRPIALTSVLLKLMERLVANRLTWCLEYGNLISDHQYGFRKGRGTIDSLAGLYDDATRALSTGKFLVVVFLDIQRAFDGVWHEAIVTKLRSLGFKGNLLSWVTSYLQGRNYSITVDGSSSSATSTCGVPQGGILSPTLFSLVVDGVTKVVPPMVIPSLYADDLTPRRLASTLEPALRDMQKALDGIEAYGKDWSLPISHAKSAVMIFSSKSVDRDVVRLTINGQVIPVVRAFKVLGLTFDDRLSWKGHLERLSADCAHRLGLLRFLQRGSLGAERQPLLTLYKSLIRSRLEYGAQLFLQAPASRRARLDKVQNRALRIATGLPRNTAIAALQVETHVPPLHLRREFMFLKTMAKNASLGRVPKGKRFLGRGSRIPLMSSLKALTAEPFLSVPFARLDRMILLPADPPGQKARFPVTFHSNWLSVRKETLSDDYLRLLFAEKVEELGPHDLHIFTDGSWDAAAQAGGIGVFCSETKQFQSRKVGSYLSICSIELVAILHALQLAMTGPATSLIVASDSQSALLSLQSACPTTGLVRDVLDCSLHFSRVSFVWVPAHCGIPGNEEADRLASLALQDAELYPAPCPLRDFYRLAGKKLHADWTKAWDEGDTGRLLYSIKAVPCDWEFVGRNKRVVDRTLAALRCRRARLPEYLHFINKADSPDCLDCGELGDTSHYLLSCSSFTPQRLELAEALQNLGLNMSVKNLLGGAQIPGPGQVKIASAVITFVQSTLGESLLKPT